MPKLHISKRASTPIEWLAVRVRDYLHMPDPSALYVLVGCLAANMLEGYPVWLMLVGPPGSGKTELLNCLLGVGMVHAADSVKGEASFLSGTSKKDVSKDATGGLLRVVGDHGALVMKDFTGVLSMNQDTVCETLNVMRQAYDGSWSRQIGTDGGRSLKWTGKLAFLAGVTGEIDRHHSVNASLGERWMYWRFDDEDGFAKSRKALTNASKSGWQKDLQDLVAAFFMGLDLKFKEPLPRRDLTDAEIVRVITMAGVAARCRSAVVRDRYSKEIIAPREQEFEGRIATALGQLLIGMEAVGVRAADRWRLLGKVSLDSMPRLRKMVLTGVLESRTNGNPLGEGVGYERLTERLGCSRSVVERTVQDMVVHDVVNTEKVGNKVMVKLSTWTKTEMEKGWQA